MIQNRIKNTQLAMLLCVVVPAGKLLSLPHTAFGQGGRDTWLGMAIAFAIEVVAVGMALVGLKHNENDLTLKQILQNTIGKFLASILLIFYAVSFFAKFLYVLIDLKILYSEVFVLKSDWSVFTLIGLLVAWFLLYKGFNVVARLSEILFVPIMICLIAISIFSLNDCNFYKLLPVANDGISKVFGSALFMGFAFGDGAILLVLSGDVKNAHQKTSQVFLGFVIGGIATIFLCVIYIALFGELAYLGDIAIARISQFNFNTSAVGRLDWLFISGWAIAVYLLLFLYAYCFTKCMDMALFKGTDHTPKPFSRAFWVYSCFALIAIFLPLLVDVKKLVLDYFAKGFVRYIDIFLTTVMAMLYPLFVKISNHKNQPTTKWLGQGLQQNIGGLKRIEKRH
ncbi:MAG: GerAB/ArcD/ProY family transporter [Clostridia bacterium]|nr:GerAB/ArcD/ProY family transporter [Clostridia bacterium]